MEKEKTEKKGRIEHEMAPVRDDLAVTLADTLNKMNGGKVAFFLDAEEDPSQIVDWVSTGNSLLDLACSNRPNGGFPCGRIVELTGLESSGKSLVGAHFLAEVQKKGGQAVFIDTEYAVSTQFLKAIGVDTDKLLYVPLNTIEDVFDNIEAIIAHVRKANKTRIVGILVDSVAAASTKKEIASDHGADGYATGKAIAISKALRMITELIATQRIALVFTNQLRQKIGFVGFGDPWTTSGGKALAFHSSLRIRLKTVGRITNAAKESIGVRVKAIVIKSRMGPPMKSVTFDIYFDRGIDNNGNWLENLREWKVIVAPKKEKEKADKKKTKKEIEEEKDADKKAKTLQFVLPVEGKDPETVVFEKKDFPKLLLERPDVKEWLYKQICEHYIMKYKSPDGELNDEVEYDSEGEGIDD
jgi:recombination protein RecA